MTDPGNEIPTIDLGAFSEAADIDKARIAEEVDEICQAIGFLVVENHGVADEVIEEAWLAARTFFDLPIEQKLALQSPAAGCPRGYFPLEEESLAKTLGIATPPDRKEAYSSGPLAPPDGHSPNAHFDFFYGENIWPSSIPTFRSAWENYYRSMEDLGARIMQLLAHALKLEEDFFVAHHTHHLGALRTLNYPSSPADDPAAAHRAGAHSDYGTVTILKPDPDVGGLEVQLPSARWIDAPPVTDGFIVNLGDLMAHWTHGRWISTVHRVTSGDATETVPRRQSIAYFMNPNYDANITTIPTCLADGEEPANAPVLAGDYLIRKFTDAQVESD